MITLTRILLNPQSRGGRRLLTNPQAMHAAVRASFPPDIDETDARVLWRVDRHENTHTLYIVGPEEPDRRVIVDQAGWATRPGETADYEPFLDRLMRGQHWAFRLVANPVSSAAPEPGQKRGRVVPHVTAAQQEAWLAERAAASGFTLTLADENDAGVPPSVLVTERRALTFSKDRGSNGPSGGRRREVTLRTARFDGVLEVTDVDVLRGALTHGLGRAKAYGCGLITLARPAR